MDGKWQPAKTARCILLNAWSTEKKYKERHKGTHDIFFGIEHRVEKEEMEEKFDTEAKQGGRTASTRQVESL